MKDQKEKLEHTHGPGCPACAQLRKEEEARKEKVEKRRSVMTDKDRKELKEKVLNSDYNKAVTDLHEDFAKKFEEMVNKFPDVQFQALLTIMPVTEDTDVIGGSPTCSLIHGDEDKLLSAWEKLRNEIIPSGLDALNKIFGMLKSGKKRPEA